MPDNEVDIKVRQSSEGDAIDQTIQKIRQLRAEAEQLRKSAAAYEAKFGFDDPAAKSARADASARESEARRLEGPITQQDKAVARQQQEDRRRSDVAAKADAQERHAVEKRITEEQRAQEAIFNNRMRIAGAIGGIAATAGGFLAQDYFARQGITLQDQAQRSSFARTMALRAERGGSASEATSQVQSIEDSLAEREFNRPVLENSRKTKAAVGAIGGAASGAATGAWIGSMVMPGVGTAVGAGIGALAGGIGGGVGGWMLGNQDLKRDDLAKSREQEELLKARAEKERYVTAETRTQLEARRAGLNYDMQGKRFAEDKVAAFREYNALVGKVGKEEAEQAATDLVRERQRERAGSLAGLINARDGAKDVARVASLAAGLDNPERAGKVFAAALRPVIEQAGSPLRDFERRERR